MGKRLESEKSLYLRQHIGNSVDWWSWGEGAFEEARRTGKLVLVSIGYSSCHWCHVMAEECFRDGYIGELMNRHYVCIKVDREERPDVDAVYMEALQMIQGRGGWPLNAFCLPDGRPFFAGTYFPGRDEGKGIIPWPQLLMRIVDYYRKNPEEIYENAENIMKNMEYGNIRVGDKEERGVGVEELKKGVEEILKGYDEEHGGFGKAPKFPPSMQLDFLMEMRELDGGRRGRIDEVVGRTLREMARGGLYDQLGGGFFRYSVDGGWKVPHYEKMLYDNAQLVGTYARGYGIYGEELYRDVVEETVGFLKRELVIGDGVLCGASLAAGNGEGEGGYYLWEEGEVREVLGEGEGEGFCAVYGVEGRAHLRLGSYEERGRWKEARGKLLGYREEKRERPERDGKVLLAWNALLMEGLVDAGVYLGRSEWIEWAEAMGDELWRVFHREGGGMRSVSYDGEGVIEGYLDDYVFYANACMRLAEVVKEGGRFRERAEEVMGYVERNFKEEGESGYYFTDKKVWGIVRKKLWMDNAMPSGNSVALECLGRMGKEGGMWGLYNRLMKEVGSAVLSGGMRSLSKVLNLEFKSSVR